MINEKDKEIFELKIKKKKSGTYFIESLSIKDLKKLNNISNGKRNWFLSENGMSINLVVDFNDVKIYDEDLVSYEDEDIKIKDEYLVYNEDEEFEDEDSDLYEKALTEYKNQKKNSKKTKGKKQSRKERRNQKR